MTVRDFLHKIKMDFKILSSYPVIEPGQPRVDYDDYWTARGRDEQAPALSRWQKERIDMLLKLLDKNSTVLDIGCGNGAVLKFLQDAAHVKGIGLDQNKKMLDKVLENGIATIEMDINDRQKIKDLPEVDYVTGFEILEHMTNPEDFLARIAPKVHKAMFFSIPNTGYYIHRLRLLFGKFPLQWASHPGEHLRFWTAADLKWWTKAYGLNVDYVKLYEGVPLLNKIIPSLFAQGIFFRISK